MNIQEAIDIALPKGTAISRKKWQKEERMLWVIPTNTSACMILLSNAEPIEQKLLLGWQPTAEDLQADDWGTY